MTIFFLQWESLHMADSFYVLDTTFFPGQLEPRQQMAPP